MRFLVDENLSPELAERLRATGHDAVAVADSDSKGSTDEAIWKSAAYYSGPGLSAALPPSAARAGAYPFPEEIEFDSFLDRLTGFLSLQSDGDLIDRITVVTPERARSRLFDA